MSIGLIVGIAVLLLIAAIALVQRSRPSVTIVERRVEAGTTVEADPASTPSETAKK